MSQSPNFHALLIGIDCYLPNKLPDGSSYSSLGGCVRDVGHVETFLRTKLNLPDQRIIMLTATNAGKEEPPEPREKWPTYENIVGSFKRLADAALPGDQVYIHYSGHGGRTPTRLPDLKGESGLDEALVPTDIGSSDARYLRDLELAHLLKTMVDKGLVVTVILDSCHSGGATRGQGGAVVRGLSTIDTTPRPTDSLVASEEALAETWGGTSAGATRALSLGSGWLPEPKGYVLLAACRASEFAYEYPFDGKERNGALTYWLLDSLKQIGPGLTYKQLHDRIVAKVHSQFERQTPQLQGEGDRVVFESERVPPQFAVNVMQVDPAKGRVMLNAGQAHAVRKGAQFVVYPPGAKDFTQLERRLALIEIEELGATDSWAKVTHAIRQDPIEQGAQAVLLDPGTLRLRRTVRLIRREDLPPSIDQEMALGRLESTLEAEGAGFLALAGDGEAPDYQVAVHAAGTYEIWDPGGELIPNLRPALRIDDEGAAARLIGRLSHLTKFHNVLQLDNFDPMSPLARKLDVELVGVQADYDPADPPEPRPFDDPGNTPELRVGEWTFLRLRNETDQVLNLTVLDLAPDWAITQVYPSGSDYFMPLDPGQEQVLPLRGDLPADYQTGKDVIKVFATVGTTNFRWLELPALDQPPTRSALTRGGPADPLERLMAALTWQKPNTRNLNPASYPSKEWVTAQVEVRLSRGGK